MRRDPQGSDDVQDITFHVSMARWKHRRRIRSENKLFTLSCLCASSLGSPYSKVLLQSHTILLVFCSIWAWRKGHGNTAPSVLYAGWISGRLVWNEVVLSIHLVLQLSASNSVWAAVRADWAHWASSGEGTLLKGWKWGFLIAKPLESIGSSACYPVWSPWTPYERWRQLRPRFTTLASINSYQLLKSQKVWLSLCCVKLVLLTVQPIVLNERT